MENYLSNPWNIQSLYDLQFFNCPCCTFKIKSRQDFVYHAYENHVECSEFLEKIKDDSLQDLDCPWSIIKEENIDPLEDVSEIFFEEVTEEINKHTQDKCHNATLKDLSVVVQSEPLPYCELCKVYFSSQAALEKHQTYVHLTILEDIQDDKIDEPLTNDHSDYMKHCEVCNLYFSCSENLQKHIDFDHEKPQISEKTQHQIYDANRKNLSDAPKYCKLCDWHFKTEATFKKHQKQNNHVDPKLRCSICNICNWKDENGLEKHYAKIHTNKKCPLCDKICENHTDFKKHLRFEHFGGGKIRRGPMNSPKDKEAKKQKSPCPSCGKLIVLKVGFS